MSMILLLKDFSVQERKMWNFKKPEFFPQLRFVMYLTTCSTFDVIKHHWLILEQSVLAGKCYRLSHILVLNSS